MISLINRFFSKKVQVNNQKDLSLGYTHISFDASVMPNGFVGIGMHDITNTVRKHSGGKVGGFSSSKGEMAALMFTLDYAKEKNLTRLNLYTDNLDLATKGIQKLLKNYNFVDVHLTWVPRELNTSADKLSKEGQKLHKGTNPIFVGPSANQTKKPKKTKNGRKAIPEFKEDGSLNSLKVFAKYTMTQKIDMLQALSNKEQQHEQEFMRMLKEQVKADYMFQVSKHNLPFIRMAKTIIMMDPKCSKYVKDRLKKLKNPSNHKGLELMSFTEFEKEFDKRKPAELVIAPKIVKPIPRTSFMMDMVENIQKAA